MLAGASMVAACDAGGGPADVGSPGATAPATADERVDASSGSPNDDGRESAEDALATVDRFGPAPTVPEGPLAPGLVDDLDALVDGAVTFGLDRPAVVRIGESGDARAAWLLADVMRFIQGGPDGDFLDDAFEALTGVRPEPVSFRDAFDHLLAWDLPAPDGYVERKGRLFAAVDPRWAVFFDDADATLDWRTVSWGGVFIDDRAEATDESGDEVRCTRGCIPALNDPAVTDADGGDWLADDGLVFGVVIGDAARAYPVHQLEVHEMVNDTLGGRRVALAFCTLCRSAQAYFTDDLAPGLDEADGGPVPGAYELRTSGLLTRSNKLTFELHTRSTIDTFTGVATSGPMLDAGVALEQVSVVTSRWGAWKREHPDTTIVAEDGGIDRSYDLDPLGGRDDDGPIFPIGFVDERLPIQELVLGVEQPDGSTVAFPVASLVLADAPVRDGAVIVRPAGSGFRAETVGGDELVSHEAFWFAWSQRFPDTAVWSP